MQTADSRRISCLRHFIFSMQCVTQEPSPPPTLRPRSSRCRTTSTAWCRTGGCGTCSRETRGRPPAPNGWSCSGRSTPSPTTTWPWSRSLPPNLLCQSCAYVRWPLRRWSFPLQGQTSASQNNPQLPTHLAAVPNAGSVKLLLCIRTRRVLA